MSYHISRLGASGRGIRTDLGGYVPTADDGPWVLSYDHGTEDTHDDDGELTEYGQWWEDEGWPEIRAAAVRGTVDAVAAVQASRGTGR